MADYARCDYEEGGRIFVGNLPNNVEERELDDLFYKYGRITDIKLVFPPVPPVFGFVSFRDIRDARDAVRYVDGKHYDGRRLRVEMSNTRGGTRGRRRYDSGGGRSSNRYERRLQSREQIRKVKKSHKKRRGESDESHDDTVGHYEGKAGDRIKEYEVIQEVGVGTFGRVLECFDLEDNERRKVAIKVVRNIKRYTESAAIEASILKEVGLKSEESSTNNGNLCVKLFADFQYKGHYCMVFESLGRSLYDYTKMNDYKPFPSKFVKAWTQQLVAAVAFLHSFDLCHTDLKPENVLSISTENEYKMENDNGDMVTVPMSAAIKVIDFGGATFDHERKSSIVNTRQYRAPEVILGIGWSKPSDCWSAGCIAAELCQGELLFATHGNREHLALMEKCLGKFPESMLDKTSDFDKYFDPKTLQVKTKGRLDSESLSHIDSMKQLKDIIIARQGQETRDTDKKQAVEESQEQTTALLNGKEGVEERGQFLELLTGLLKLNPSERMTAQQAVEVFGEYQSMQ